MQLLIISKPLKMRLFLELKFFFRNCVLSIESDDRSSILSSKKWAIKFEMLPESYLLFINIVSIFHLNRYRSIYVWNKSNQFDWFAARFPILRQFWSKNVAIASLVLGSYFEREKREKTRINACFIFATNWYKINIFTVKDSNLNCKRASIR